jgi:hypothetical protein
MQKLSIFLKKYSFLFGLILFVTILSRTNVGEIFQNIKNINPLYLVLALLISLPMLINKTLCWHYIIKQQGIKYNLKDSFLMYCSGLYIGILTPGRLGEITKALYLKKDGHSMGKSLVGAILDRLSDFAFLLVFIFAGSLFFLTIFQKQVLILILGIVISVFLLVIFLETGLIKWGLNKIFHIFVPEKYQKSWKINFQDFINDLKIYKLKHYLVIFLITAFSWVFYYLQMYVLAKGVGINVPFLYLAISVTIAGLITLIPISISGIGTRDAALIILLVPLSISIEKIIAFSTLILFLVIWAAFIGLICWLIKPIKI